MPFSLSLWLFVLASSFAVEEDLKVVEPSESKELAEKLKPGSLKAIKAVKSILPMLDMVIMDTLIKIIALHIFNTTNNSIQEEDKNKKVESKNNSKSYNTKKPSILFCFIYL